MPASEFHEKGSKEQLELINKCSVAFPKLKIWVRVRGDSIFLLRLSLVQTNYALSRSLHRGTPSSVMLVVSDRRQVSFEEFSQMRRTLDEVYEMIAGGNPSSTDTVSPASIAAETSCRSGTRSATVSGTKETGEVDGSMLCTMSRRELQTLCKKYSIPANKSNACMVEALDSKFKQMGAPVDESSGQ